MTVARRAIFALMFALNVALTICLAYLYVSRGYDTSGSFSSVELITIVLTALAVLLTTLGIFIAILAVWGYQALHSVAKETAQTVAGKVAERVAKTTADEVASRTAADAVARLDESVNSNRDYGEAAGRSNGDET